MLGAAVVVFVAVSTTASAQKSADKPRVPPGVDPGGVAVAIIGGGIDYTRPGIAARLARDGEGEIIGWDFVDDDRRPYQACSPRESGRNRCAEEPILVIGEAEPRARFVVVRVSPGEPKLLVDAFKLIAGTAARIVVLGEQIPAEIGRSFAFEAGMRFPGHFIFAPTGRDHPPVTAGATPQVERAAANVFFADQPAALAGRAARELSSAPGLTTGELAQILSGPAPLENSR